MEEIHQTIRRKLSKIVKENGKKPDKVPDS
jgi:hypothetical protein